MTIRQRHMEQVKQMVKDAMSDGRCVICGTKRKLTFHHRYPPGKSFTVGTSMHKHKHPADVKREINKCDLLCEACHKEAHVNLFKYDELKLQTITR